MKAILIMAAWAATSAFILFAALNPTTGVIFQSPGAVLGLGLIGLGVCVEVRQRRLAAAMLAAHRDQTPRQS